MSLTLGRRANESIIIDPQGLNIRVSAYAVGPYGEVLSTKVRISIEADSSIKIVREELLTRPGGES